MLENGGSIGYWKPKVVDGELDWEILRPVRQAASAGLSVKAWMPWLVPSIDTSKFPWTR